MDINLTLRELRELLDLDVIDASSDAEVSERLAEASERLAEVSERFAALDQWLSRGGFLPVRWKQGRWG